MFGNDAGRVIRLDGAGRVVWTVETGGEIELPLVLTDDGVVGAVSGGDTLVALDADTGHERWRAGGQPPVAALAAVGTRLLLLGREGERARVYIPVVSMILVSIALSVLAWIFRQR